jgi:hypothetical protein
MLDNFQTGTITSLEAEIAVIKLADGQEVRWPAKLLPPEVTQGSAVQLTLTRAGETGPANKAVAQEILNEIFLADENTTH